MGKIIVLGDKVAGVGYPVTVGDAVVVGDRTLTEVVNDIQFTFDVLTNVTDTTEQIDTMREIIDFLDTFKNTDNLASILSSLETRIQEWVVQNASKQIVFSGSEMPTNDLGKEDDVYLMI